MLAYHHVHIDIDQTSKQESQQRGNHKIEEEKYDENAPDS